MKYERSDFTAGIPNMKARNKTMDKNKDVYFADRMKNLVKEAEALGEQKADLLRSLESLDQAQQLIQANLQALQSVASQLLPMSSQIQQQGTIQQPPAMPPSAGETIPQGMPQEMPQEMPVEDPSMGISNGQMVQEGQPPIAMGM